MQVSHTLTYLYDTFLSIAVPRIRKVKCDEGFPVCHRCHATGRKCDGYGVWGGGENGQSQHLGPSKQSVAVQTRRCFMTPPRELPRTSVSFNEKCCLDWFAHRTAIKLPGVFAPDFWKTTLFQVSINEPAVLHAVIALSSTQRRYVSPSDDVNQEDIFVLQQYSQAIVSLQAHRLRANKASIHVTLITCLVFIYMEFLRGHYRTGLIHLEHGLKLLQQIQDSTNVVQIVSSKNLSIEERVTGMFRRIYMQARLFDQDLAYLPTLLPRLRTKDESNYFTSSSQARQCLENLLLRIVDLQDRYRQLQLSPTSQPVPPHSALQNSQADIIEDLNIWFEMHTSKLSKHNKSTKFLHTFARKLLDVYYTMANIMLATATRTCEMDYDKHTLSFTSIVNQSLGLYELVSPLKLTDQNIIALLQHDLRRFKSTDSIVEMGWIPGLYYTAIKCRIPWIRRQAIQLLKSTSHKEGIADSTLAVTIAEKVMEIEEQDFYDNETAAALNGIDIFAPEESGIHQWSTVVPLPESHRIQDVKVELPEDAEGQLRLTCYRNQDYGELGMIMCAYDVATQSWTREAT
ncbi:hypothetical protein H2198_000449 [Neophaeococcomyces mojaviensis]|uniref:Uncharacterized protein n=1 Tax=Neophaeococcomyces mojaviensis TaxID=3383035 RepID=A0ACC3AKA4_9EURO|nr:hypothetical protein H2198_000449 [Knufia sp. JES_112]